MPAFSPERQQKVIRRKLSSYVAIDYHKYAPEHRKCIGTQFLHAVLCARIAAAAVESPSSPLPNHNLRPILLQERRPRQQPSSRHEEPLGRRLPPLPEMILCRHGGAAFARGSSGHGVGLKGRPVCYPCRAVLCRASACCLLLLPLSASFCMLWASVLRFCGQGHCVPVAREPGHRACVDSPPLLVPSRAIIHLIHRTRLLPATAAGDDAAAGGGEARWATRHVMRDT
jgi:hypothetical protein